MVICVCNAIRERDVRLCAQNGCQTPCQAFRSMGREAKCGQCAVVARAIMDDERAAA